MKEPLRTKSIGAKVSDEEFTALGATARTALEADRDRQARGDSL
jgi:hypothetical protein